MRILLAEDDRSQAESIQSWLELDGYQVDWVERGDYALQQLNSMIMTVFCLIGACPNWLVKKF
jgi:DNA-binding response OmpR family regulator